MTCLAIHTPPSRRLRFTLMAALAATAALWASPAWAQRSDAIRQELFGELEARFVVADTEELAVLSPKNYKEARESLDKAWIPFLHKSGERAAVKPGRRPPMKRFAMPVVLSLFAGPLLAAPGPGGAQQEPQYVNAGVFPYSTASGDILVLLGFDGDRASWSDFVGTCTPGETPPDTAAREFSEETRGAFPGDRIVTRLETLEPVRIEETLLFLLEVPPISAAEISRLTKSRTSEKTAYCWVPLAALLASIDESGPGRAQVPEFCRASSLELFDVAANNLVEGRELRAKLFIAPDEEAARTSTTWPRCGR